ncbi:MAG: Mg2+ and Co2+ transporter CorB [Bacillota bacterium]|nr:Mg2+ and Co2+ transporter CorB [Bacillota bacterium]
MEEKRYFDDKKIKFKPSLGRTKNKRGKWIFFISIFVASFILTGLMTVISSSILEGVNEYIALIVVLLIILTGITFDIIGMSVAAADETPFHAMASRKVSGAKQAIKLIRNADKISALCNDVIGDICGVISGSVSAYIILRLATRGNKDIIELVITGLVASLTVCGKAFGKTIAISRSNYIVYKVSIILNFLLGRINFKLFSRRKKIKDG